MKLCFSHEPPDMNKFYQLNSILMQMWCRLLAYRDRSTRV
uniref:Uncharacterized protein n=1 Tax=Arundo donax TaxID=35708 RepID=A0A0A9EYG2_ARUDO